MEEKFDHALASKIRALAEEKGPEPYEIGAWEAFEAKAFGKRGNPYRFIWIGLAASFLMAMSINTINQDTNSSSIQWNTFLAFQPHLYHNRYSTLDNSDNYNITHVNAVDNVDPKIQNSALNNYQGRYLVETARMSGFNSSFNFADFISAKAYYPSNYLRLPGKSHYAKYQSGFIPYIQNQEKSSNDNKRLFKIGVWIASGMNMIEMKRSGCTIGAGLGAEIPLAQNIFLNTGLVLNAQKLTYKNYNGESPVMTHAKLIALDLPVNLKYNFIKKKNKEFFVAAGVSSLAYIKENFTDRNINDEQNLPAHQEAKSLKGFDLAKFINFSLGVEIPLEKQLSLLIEPYLKYPVGGNKNNEVLYSSAGLNFRLNMGLAKLY